MKDKVFKYKFITAIVLTFSFVMLFFCGIGFFDLMSRITVRTDYFIVIILALLILVNATSIVLILIKSKKSVLTLNIFYGSVVILFLTAFVMREFGNADDYSLTDRIIFISILSITISLTFLINKFRYKVSRYDEIEFIGKHQE